MTLNDKSVQVLLEKLASSSPTPGGGSAAALTGAMGAALVSMVCNVSIGKTGMSPMGKPFADLEDELRSVLEGAEALRRQLTALADADAHAFDQVMAAYRLPKQTEEEKTFRRSAIQQALQHATQTPLETAAACAAVVRLVDQVISKINPNALSDAGAAALLAEAGMRGAQLNVAINLAAVRDTHFVQEKQETLDRVLAGTQMAKDRVFSFVLEHIG